MQVQVRFFAAAREAVGAGERVVRLKDGSTVGDLVEQCAREHPGLGPLMPSLMIAVNREFAKSSDVLREGDEVGMIPPVSGGGDV
ncbi:MAG: molybdopterin converting factor subunit 1 [Candidatus Methylomirabilales bacterium]